MLKLHERTKTVQQARNTLQGHVIDVVESHELTAGEVVCILLELARNWANYVLREERHPDDPEKKADEA